MTKKRLKQTLNSTLHVLVFLSLCAAPLLSNVLQTIDVEESISINNKKASEDSSEGSSEIGLNNPLKSFWSFTRLSQRYFASRKITDNQNFQSKTFQSKLFYNSFRSNLLTDKHFILEQPTPHLADAKRYLSLAKLQLEGG